LKLAARLAIAISKHAPTFAKRSLHSRLRRASALRTCRSLRCDVLVRTKQVLRIPTLLDLCETTMVAAVGGKDAIGAFVFGEKVDVRAARREPAHVLPRRA